MPSGLPESTYQGDVVDGIVSKMGSAFNYRDTVRFIFALGISCLVVWVLVITVEGFLPGVFTSIEPYRTLYENVLPHIAAIGIMMGGYLFLEVLREEKKVLKEIDAITKETGGDEFSQRLASDSFLLSDSTDREVLRVINETGGRILDVLDELSKQALVAGSAGRRKALAKLIMLGLIVISTGEKRFFLTSRGIDTLNTPALLLRSQIPENVWSYIYQMKVNLLQEKWGNVVVEMARALEAALRERLRWMINKNPSEWESIKKDLPKKDLEIWTGGHLRNGLAKMGYIKQNTLEDFLVLDLVRLRNLIHDKEEVYTFGPADADRCDIYLGLLMRAWYGPS